MKKEKPTTKICKYCKTEIPFDAKICPQCRKKQSGGGCLVAIGVVVAIGVLGSCFSGNSSSSTNAPVSTETHSDSHSFLLDYNINIADVKSGLGNNTLGKCAYITIPTEELSQITSKDLKDFADTFVSESSYNWVSITTDSGYGICFPGSNSMTATYGKLDSLGAITEAEGAWILKNNEYVYESITPETTVEETVSAEENVPTEYKSALRQADTYANTMHMSKIGLYDQLTSEYGGKFSAEAAQYAVDNVVTDWNANALASAQNYSDNMHMSKAGIYNQLISEYGEKFTEEEAQYGVDNVDADWNENALATAKNYQDNLALSPEAIRDQLTSEYGDKFTQEEADYAISHLE